MTMKDSCEVEVGENKNKIEAANAVSYSSWILISKGWKPDQLVQEYYTFHKTLLALCQKNISNDLHGLLFQRSTLF